jgi:hypothetical protein
MRFTKYMLFSIVSMLLLASSTVTMGFYDYENDLLFQEEKNNSIVKVQKKISKINKELMISKGNKHQRLQELLSIEQEHLNCMQSATYRGEFDDCYEKFMFKWHAYNKGQK